jgi:hypothetical protein
MIAAKHPIREKIAGLSTTNNYYETKGHAIKAVNDVLGSIGYETAMWQAPGDDGRELIPIVHGFLDDGPVVAQLVFAWHRMPSGRYEITMYIA